MCRQVSRIESAAAWSWTVQVSDPTRTIAVRDAESYRAYRRSSPCARTLSAGPMLPCPWMVGTSAGRPLKIHWSVVGEPGLGVDGRGGHVVQGDHQLLAEGGGEVAADGAGPAAVGVDPTGWCPAMMMPARMCCR